MNTRRDFIRKTLAGSAFLIAGGIPEGFNPIYGGGKNRLNEKIRIIIETDAGGDPDDEQSLVRFLLYANVFDIEGIIANRKVARPRENKNPVRDGLGIVRAMVNAYGQCYPNLLMHDKGYPSPEHLMKCTVPGYDDTDDGVDLIINSVDAPDHRPVWFCNWGTDDGSSPSCMRRALDTILKDRGHEGYARFKNRIQLSSADKFGDHTTVIDPPFPLWVDTWRPPVENKRWYHRFSPITAKAGGFDIERDVRTGHGPLGSLYPLNTNYPQKEGDTMSFLYLVPTGMNDPYQPGWGSWVGRYGLNREEHTDKNYYWANQSDTWNGTTNRDNMLARWAEAFQNDFRVRMDWCVKKADEANHHPVAILNGHRSGIIYIETKPGREIRLNAGKSYDPDGNDLSPNWFIYGEAGTYMKEIALSSNNSFKTSFIAPEVEKTETIHLIFELKNSGIPPLYSYRRIIVTIKN